jgi:hypothetical protein
VLNALGKSLLKPGFKIQNFNRGLDDRGIIQMPRVIQQAAVALQTRKDRAVLQCLVVCVCFAKNADGAEIVLRVGVSPQGLAGEVGRGCQPALLAVAIDKERLLDFVEHIEFQVLRNFGGEQVKAKGMDSADIHFGHTVDLTELFPAARDDALLQFSSSLLRKSECNNVARCETTGVGPQQLCDAAGNDFRLA